MTTGGADCGKTCLAFSEYKEEYLATIGVDFKIYKHQSPNGKEAKIQVWDLAGHMFANQLDHFYRTPQLILFVYNVQ